MSQIVRAWYKQAETNPNNATMATSRFANAAFHITVSSSSFKQSLPEYFATCRPEQESIEGCLIA